MSRPWVCWAPRCSPGSGSEGPAAPCLPRSPTSSVPTLWWIIYSIYINKLSLLYIHDDDHNNKPSTSGFSSSAVWVQPYGVDISAPLAARGVGALQQHHSQNIGIQSSFLCRLFYISIYLDFTIHGYYLHKIIKTDAIKSKIMAHLWVLFTASRFKTSDTRQVKWGEARRRSESVFQHKIYSEEEMPTAAW